MFFILLADKISFLNIYSFVYFGKKMSEKKIKQTGCQCKASVCVCICVCVCLVIYIKNVNDIEDNK